MGAHPRGGVSIALENVSSLMEAMRGDRRMPTFPRPADDVAWHVDDQLDALPNYPSLPGASLRPVA
jgi:hypothetical protein